MYVFVLRLHYAKNSFKVLIFNKNSNDAIRLWAVNDMSDHKSLIQHELALHRPHRCKPGKLLLTQVLQSNPIPQIELPHEALELRAGEQKLENYIFLRSKQSLAVANCDKVSFLYLKLRLLRHSSI